MDLQETIGKMQNYNHFVSWQICQNRINTKGLFEEVLFEEAFSQ